MRDDTILDPKLGLYMIQVQYALLGYHAGTHFAPSLRFLTKTDCPISNSLDICYEHEHHGNASDLLAFPELSSV